MTASAGAGFDYDFSRAMGTLPLSGGLTSTLNATYAPGELTVTAQRDAGWQAPSLFIDGMDDVDFGKPALTVRGDYAGRHRARDGQLGRGRAQPQRENAVAGARRQRPGAGVPRGDPAGQRRPRVLARLGAADGAGWRPDPQRYALRAAGAGHEAGAR